MGEILNMFFPLQMKKNIYMQKSKVNFQNQHSSKMVTEFHRENAGEIYESHGSFDYPKTFHRCCKAQAIWFTWDLNLICQHRPAGFCRMAYVKNTSKIGTSKNINSSKTPKFRVVPQSSIVPVDATAADDRVRWSYHIGAVLESLFYLKKT